MSGTAPGSILNETCSRPLEPVGAQGGVDQRQLPAQDPVRVQPAHLVDQRDRRGLRRPGATVALGRLGAGSNRARNSSTSAPRRGRMGQQDLRDVRPSERSAQLRRVVRVGPQQRHLPPFQPGPQHQRVEPVGRRRAGPGRAERRAEQLPGPRPAAPGHRPPGHRLHRQPEVVEPAGAAVRPDDLVRALVEHLDTQAVQHRQHRRQRDARAGQQEPEVQLVPARAGLVGQLEVRPVGQVPDAPQIGQRAHRIHVVLVALRQPGQQLDEVLGLPAGRVQHPVVPGQDGRRELPAQPLDVRLRGGRIDLDGEVHQHRPRFPDGDRVVDAPAVQLAQQHPLHGRPGRGGVAVLREVHQAGEEPAVRLAAQRHPQPAALGQRQHADRGLVQVLRRGPEQLLARQPGDHLQQSLAAVGLHRHPGPVHRREHPAPDHRRVQHRLVQRGGGEQPDEPVLPAVRRRRAPPRTAAPRATPGSARPPG